MIIDAHAHITPGLTGFNGATACSGAAAVLSRDVAGLHGVGGRWAHGAVAGALLW